MVINRLNHHEFLSHLPGETSVTEPFFSAKHCIYFLFLPQMEVVMWADWKEEMLCVSASLAASGM